jgi:hypothetical protein
VDVVSYCPGSGDLALVSTSNPPGTTSRPCPGIYLNDSGTPGVSTFSVPAEHGTYQAGTPVEITVTVQASADRAVLAKDTKTITPLAS